MGNGASVDKPLDLAKDEYPLTPRYLECKDKDRETTPIEGKLLEDVKDIVSFKEKFKPFLVGDMDRLELCNEVIKLHFGKDVEIITKDVFYEVVRDTLKINNPVWPFDEASVSREKMAKSIAEIWKGDTSILPENKDLALKKKRAKQKLKANQALAKK